MKLADKYPNLKQFFGCHFHQDWSSDYGTSAEGVQDFLNGFPVDCIISTTNELVALLNEIKSDQVLSQALSELACDYDPSHSGRTDREWLTTEVLPMFKAYLSDRQAKTA